ncbi:ATP-binding cassette domain-containing protein [Lachnospiraceae bacterium 54-53]
MIIQFKNVEKTFTGRKSQVQACRDINLTVEKGDIFGVVGYSGAGKSTLIRMVNALERPTSGKVVVNGEVISELKGNDLRKARKGIAMIFQQFNLLNAKTVYENVAMPLILNHTPREEIKKRVDEILNFVELSDKADTYPGKLSGGQKQRVGVARALTTNPSILLCDEPTSALDPKTTDSILNLLRKVNRELDITIMIITHQINIVQKICNKVAVMENGYVVEQGDVKEVFARPVQPITKAFVDTVVDQSIPDTIFAAAAAEIQNSKILKVRCLDGNVCDTFTPDLRKKFTAEIHTLFMSVNEMQGSILTVIGLQIKGTKAQIKEVESYLGENYEYEEVAV